MNETSYVVDAERREVTITRDFDAPRELIFKAYMDPEQFVNFWGPSGTTVPLDSVTIEPWAGGRFESTIVVDDDGAEYPMSFTFVEVVEPERFTFTSDSGIVSTTTLTDLGNGRTRLVVHQTNVPDELRTAEALAGFGTTMDLLAAHLAKALS